MSDGSKLLLFILLIPFFLAMGHDVYYNYFSNPKKIEKSTTIGVDPAEFRATDMGWVVIEYSPGTFKAIKHGSPEFVWKNIIDPIFRLPTMVVGLIPFCIGLLITMLNGFLGQSAFQSSSKDYMQGKGFKSSYKRR